MLPRRTLHALCALFSALAYLPVSYAAPADGTPSAASFYVRKLPDLHQDEARPLRIYAGHISSDPDEKDAKPTDVTAHLFFFLIKARRTADKERLVFWLNGGPGCSSFDGLMMEVGPFQPDGKGGLKLVPGSWDEYTTMVFVDQPAGTGFSYAASNKYDHELTEAGAHFIEFVRNFYKVFPEYERMDTYITGESFAGQYIPYFADAILNSNLGMPLRGVAIGNGWMDARRQYPSYIEYAVKHGLVEEGSDAYKTGKEVTEACVQLWNKATDFEPVRIEECENVMTTVVQHRNRDVDGQPKCLNIYDVRLEDDSPYCGMHWPSTLADTYTYLARKDVVSAIHASTKPGTWTECAPQIHTELRMKKSPSAVTVLPRVLERIPVLLFVGDQDLICNYVGIESMIQAMKWNGETGLGKVQTESWAVAGAPAGTWVTSRNLTYVKIFNGSHMPAVDVPHVTHDMILRFMGVNFTAITDGSARIPSTVGGAIKPVPILDEAPPSTPSPVKTEEQNKAMWEAYYNAGSAALVLVLVAVALIGVFWWRSRRTRLRGLPLSTHEENIPLNSAMADDPRDDSGHDSFRQRKGKERAIPDGPELFEVGSDDEDERSPRR